MLNSFNRTNASDRCWVRCYDANFIREYVGLLAILVNEDAKAWKQHVSQPGRPERGHPIFHRYDIETSSIGFSSHSLIGRVTELESLLEAKMPDTGDSLAWNDTYEDLQADGALLGSLVNPAFQKHLKDTTPGGYN